MSSRKLAIHHQGVHESYLRMSECARQTADGFEPETQPKLHRSLIRAHNKIKLHRTEAALLRAFERVHAHRSRNSPSLRLNRGYVPAVRNMRATTLLVCLQEIRTQHDAVFFPNKRLFF